MAKKKGSKKPGQGPMMTPGQMNKMMNGNKKKK